MNNSDLIDQGRLVAIAATVNLLIKELDQHAIGRLKHGLVAEMQRIADGNGQVVAAGISYAEKAFDGLA